MAEKQTQENKHENKMVLPITKEISDLGDTLKRYFWLIVVAIIFVGIFVVGLLIYLFSK